MPAQAKRGEGVKLAGAVFGFRIFGEAAEDFAVVDAHEDDEGGDDEGESFKETGARVGRIEAVELGTDGVFGEDEKDEGDEETSGGNPAEVGFLFARKKGLGQKDAESKGNDDEFEIVKRK